MHEAKTRLSELLRGVEAGDEVTVTRGGHPVARIVPIESVAPAPKRSLFGILADEISDAGDWEYDEEEANAMGDLFGIPRDEDARR